MEFLNTCCSPMVRIFKRLIPTLLFFAALIVVAALLFWAIQGVPLLDAFYWSVVTGFTVGYGDVLPTVAAAKFLAGGLIILSAITWAVLAGHVVALVIESRTDFTAEDEQKMFDDLQELRCELQAVINHLGITVDYSENGAK